MNHTDTAFQEYALRFLLVPGQRLRSSEVPGAAGLPVGEGEGLPSPLRALLARADDLGHDPLVISGADPLLAQWSPYAGAWPLYVEGAFGARLLDDHRWVQRAHEAGARALYDALHEATHGAWAAVGLMGVIGGVSLEGLDRFHALSEAAAVLVGDLEGPERLAGSGLWGRHWPASASRSHAVGFSPPAALAAAGLSDPDERARWLFEVYADHRRDLPTLPEDPGLRAEALAFLVEEGSYAEKVASAVGPAWSRAYWARPELMAFRADFVPPTPVQLPHLREPLLTPDDCARAWRALTLEPWDLPPLALNHLRARLSLQRRALKVCELESALSSYRVVPVGAEGMGGIEEGLRLLSASREALLSELHASLLSPEGARSDEGLSETLARHEAEARALAEGLCGLLGEVITFEHPHLDRLPFRELATPLTERAGALDAPRDALTLGAALTLARDEARLYCQHLDAAPAQDKAKAKAEVEAEGEQGLYDLAERVYLEAHMLLGALELSPTPARRAEAEGWLSGLERSRQLWLPYPTRWLYERPFVEPLVGFRFR